ncbi:hypothetical protein BGW36DRAFT_427506 [Talaromyces proteolyticus]|uniref:Metallothionein-I gene transcription activator n=1 Tax=Talaromyces proteolyticus TaxID=1131652 RepID=A0AAD4Q0T5_9EURO|nr:uncharacterized protein BGW36DRAFT_427506 [Talaromyces proteolyticus]KAH8697548.1 hypothetical protein BGW36DRAFT_427506 [Talaromyces proteolyticus]
MSREAYQVPSLGSNGGVGGQSGFATTESPAAVRYICGDCDSKFALQQNSALRCPECGHRILYKERTKRMVQFEAR